jgi:hypothetical protein
MLLLLLPLLGFSEWRHGVLCDFDSPSAWASATALPAVIRTLTLLSSTLVVVVQLWCSDGAVSGLARGELGFRTGSITWLFDMFGKAWCAW